MELILFASFISFSVYVFLSFKELKENKGKTPVGKKFSLETDFTRISIRNIVRWEQMQGKSFSLMDYSDREDIEALLYTMSIDNLNNQYKYEVFKSVLEDGKVMEDMTASLGKAISVMAQFRNNSDAVGSEGSDTAPETIGNIVATLVMSGLDASYAFNEMEICDLPLYIDAYERKRREEMESSRLWTYLTILPHIDSKSMENGAKDLITFPWEVLPKKETEISDKEVEEFEEFMKKGKKLWQEN